jgi:sortase A
MVRKLLTIFFTLLMVGGFGFGLYQMNVFHVRSQVVSYQNARTTKVIKTAVTGEKRQAIAELLMKQTHSDEGLTKQGFVAVPSVGILQPIFDSAYTDKGLNAGANYANRSEVDPTGQNIPVMGQGNYGLASHNFNDGHTGFSPLQEKLDQDDPYLVNGKFGTSDWLDGKAVYLANGDHIYEYTISGQDLVKKGTISVLNPTADPEVTIITCLFPSTEYRIITHAKLTKSWDWQNAPAVVVNYFDLTVQKTNAHLNSFNPGEEEGVN